MENQIGQWIVIGIAVAFIAFDKAKTWFTAKKERSQWENDDDAAKARRASSVGLAYNPRGPGNAQSCRDAREAILENEKAVRENSRAINENGRIIARMEANQGDMCRRLGRIEDKMNGVLRG